MTFGCSCEISVATKRQGNTRYVAKHKYPNVLVDTENLWPSSLLDDVLR